MMDGDRSSQNKYTLPVKFEELLDQRNFTYVSISGGMSGELRNFVIWLSKPLTEVRARAEAFIRRLYGRDLSYDLYPKNYVREARRLARLGMHEDAPLGFPGGLAFVPGAMGYLPRHADKQRTASRLD